MQEVNELLWYKGNLEHNYNFNQPHVAHAVLDYRFRKNDGSKFLEGIGINISISYTYGHSYTPSFEDANDIVNLKTPWEIDTDFIKYQFINKNSELTPNILNVDLNLNKEFYLKDYIINLYVGVINLFNKKHIINVHPLTNDDETDGWLNNNAAMAFFIIPNYVDFYRTINDNNRWNYQKITGNNIYGIPRQIHFGISISR